MKRRDFVKGAAVLAAGASVWPMRGFSQQAGAEQVKRVLALFMCHLDVGFTNTQANVMRLYFDRYFPEAIKTAAQQRATGGDPYVWTTGSWLLYEYLEQANAAERRQMEQSIAAGDIAWHALPFNWQTEMLDRSMIVGSLGLSESLDRRFGKKTTGAKMADVPGHSRGIVGPLAERGVKLLHIGVNGGSTPPEVPEAFVWKDDTGASLIMLYSLHSYGSVIQVPHSDLAVAIMMRSDNGGPHSVAEIHQVYADLRKQFPQAQIKAANASEIAAAVEQFESTLPVVTQEIGDTWIYGIPSDPLKVARYREAARLRDEWITQGAFKSGDATDCQLLRRLALAVEHTWGTDTKRYLDYDHYTPADLKKVLDQPGYKTMEHSWQEKRDDIDEGLANLPAALKTEAGKRLKSVEPVEPSYEALESYSAPAVIETEHFRLALDPKTGALMKFANRKMSREWASEDHPLALFTYQTLSAAEFATFNANYNVSKASWVQKDFGKPNIAHFGAEAREWHPRVMRARAGRRGAAHYVIAELKIDDPASESQGRVAWPQRMFVELTLPDAEPVCHMRFSSFEKQINRMPEAMWLTFQPLAPDSTGWTLEKVNQRVRPDDVVRGGNRYMHAVTRSVHYEDPRGTFEIAALDAPVVALGERSPIAFTKKQPDLSRGLHFSLFNNAWGTNYPQWCGGDWLYRFTLRG